MAIDHGKGRQPSSPRRRAALLHGRRSPVLTIVFWTLLAYFMLPLAWFVVNATKSNCDLFVSFGLAFADTFAFFDNIGQLATYQDGIFFRWFANTILLRRGRRGRRRASSRRWAATRSRSSTSSAAAAYSPAILEATAVPGTALAVPIYMLFSQWGLINTEAAVIIPALARPFGLFPMMVYARDAVPGVDARGGAGSTAPVRPHLLDDRLPAAHARLRDGAAASSSSRPGTTHFLPLIVLNRVGQVPLTVGLSLWNKLANAGG